MAPAPLPIASPAEIDLSKDALGRLSSAFAREIESKRLPGVVALIARQGRVGFLESLGARDPKTGAAMTPDAIFRIYSMTKPIVSVATMMLLEEGRLLLGEPISKYLPDFAAPKVAIESHDNASGRVSIELVPAAREITVQDLLRHTSGLTYEFRGSTAVHKRYIDAQVFRRDQTNSDFVATLAKLPLLYQPGSRWEYSRSTDVLGRLIEVIAGKPLGEVLAERFLRPLGMADTGFHVPAAERHRVAEPFETDPDTGEAVSLLDVRDPPMFQSGGGGMVSTAQDYARFLAMLANRGTLDGVRLLGRKTVEFMTADHLGSIPGAETLAGPGYGFGLGFAVRLADGIAPTPGSAGQYYWGGIAGTTFWVDPREELVAIMMIQAPGQREHYRALFRNLVYASLAD
jgi:CubicO group peptidase (beta-lactamase class C family)